MTLYEKLEKTFDDKNVEAYLDLLHDDFVVVLHHNVIVLINTAR